MNNNMMISILKGIQKDYPLTNAEWQAIEQAKENAKNKAESDCRDCKEYEDCPCGKDGHESETSQGYSIGECKDFEPQESEE